MRDLAKWQIISFISRGFAQIIGLIPTFFFLRIFTVPEWGTVQLVLSIAAAWGIYQHLGLASASTREISAAKSEKEIFKVFVVSALIRYIVSIPLAVILFLMSDKISAAYANPQIALPLKISAIVLLVGGFQSLFNSVISGTQRFKSLFIYQSAIALVNVLIYLPLVYLYKVNGYFYASFLLNLVASITLGILAFGPMKNYFSWPDKKEWKGLFKELLSISLAIYAVKIIYTNWERLGPNYLGLHVSAEALGYFTFALVFSKKLMNISDAVTDVNLPVFSDVYVHSREKFEKLFSDNFKKVFVLVVFIGMSAVYWVREISLIFSGSYTKYEQAYHLVLPIIFAFILYSFVNILKSSIIIPAKKALAMIISFAVLFAATLVFYFIGLRFFDPLTSMAYGMVFGAFMSLAFMILYIQFALKIKLVNHDYVLILIHGLVISSMWDLQNIWVKGGFYILLSALFIWGTFIAHFVTRDDISYVRTKVSKKLKRI